MSFFKSINGKIIQQQDFEISYTKQRFYQDDFKTVSEQQQLFSQIELYFNSNYLVEQIKLVDGESCVLIRLSLQVNQPIAESVLKLKNKIFVI